MKLISFIFKAIIIAYLIIFSVANTQKITLNIFLDDMVLELPTFLLVIAVLAIGSILGLLSQVSDKWKLRREIRRLKTSLSHSSVEYAKIKNLALSDDVSTKQIKNGEENNLVKKQIR